MTLAEVLARAREQAPQIVSARLALEEARGRLVGASVRFQANPQIDAAVGNRNGPDTRFTDFELGLGQSFEPRCPPVRSDRRSQRRDRAELRECRGGHANGAPVGGFRVLPSGARE